MSMRLIIATLCCLSVQPLLAAKPDFNRDVAPILVKRCLECHNDRQKAGGFVLITAKLAFAGGDSGKVILPGDTANSHFIERITSGEMPPKRRGVSQRLPNKEIATLKAWIQAGAKWPAKRKLDLYETTNDVRGGRDWWSLQPVRRPQVPKIAGATNAIDAFVLTMLRRQKLTPAPIASKRALIRRVYIDMLGLPPTFEQVEAFLKDTSPKAWEKVVDQLLKSPQFGERWGRHWLDLVRFAETCGYERDQVKPYVWRYRDWVVNAINNDKPYDQFIREQLAGDELPNRSEQTVIATGFLRVGTWNDEPNDPNEYKYERLEDMVHATSSAFLALTIKCARCHDHKFDPILQRDYYRVASAFWAGTIDPASRANLGGPSAKLLGFKNVFGWTDKGRVPTPLRLLKNGDPKKPREIVAPAHLSTIPAIYRKFRPPAKGAKTSQRRLQLAEWITDPRNPLTARVIVNRLWQHHFGEGLVRTPNNFGFRGNRPTHPQLLDYLAAELVAGKWKLKRIHRMMLMSRTYRQSSLHSDYKKHQVADSTNLFWWKANRRRLDAESLRDSMLLASGQLDLQMGGKSFRPTIAPEALEGLSRKQAAWTPSSYAEQRRRSLYIFSKRGLLPPMMTTFDFVETTLPCGRRNSTTVPPQALAMMNNHFVHRQSSEMAKAVRKVAGKSVKAQVQTAWRMAYARQPSAGEVELGLQHLAVQRTRFDQTKNTQKNDKFYKDLPVASGLVLHLRADRGVKVSATGRLTNWNDRSPRKHHASQAKSVNQPLLVKRGFNGKPVIRFDGKQRFLHVQGKLLPRPETSMFAVVNDRGSNGHREIISNWNRTNSTTSIFLGLTRSNTVRFSDLFVNGSITGRQKPFVLTAINSSRSADLYQSNQRIASAPRLSGRNLNTPWVIGQQGNINGEYWKGDIAEIIVYNRAVTRLERQRISDYLKQRYAITGKVVPAATPEELALASLCHVLLNSNEFLYVD